MRKTKSQIAKLAGKTHQWVSREAKTGRLVVDADGKIDLENSVNAGWLRGYGVNPEDITDADTTAHAGRCALDNLPPELCDMTIPEILRAALPYGGKNIPPATWFLIWRCVRTAQLYHHGNDERLLAFERTSGLPAAVCDMTLERGLNFLVSYDAATSNARSWQEIYLELRQMYGV